jgi:hypothetical protein
MGTDPMGSVPIYPRAEQSQRANEKGVPRLCRAALILNLSSRGSPAGAFRRFHVGAHTSPLWRGNLAS